MMVDRGDVEAGRSGDGARTRASARGAPARGLNRTLAPPRDETLEASFVILESGRIRFFVRPRQKGGAPSTSADVVRFGFTLAPQNGALVRRITVGERRMPDDAARERRWAQVDRVGAVDDVVVGGLARAPTRRRPRRRAEAVEIAVGRYAIASHRDHVHLLYALEDEPSATRAPLLDQLRVLVRGSFVAAALCSGAEARGEPSAAVDGGGAGRRFGGARLSPLEPSQLDHEGAELVLIAGGNEPSGALDRRLGRRPPPPTARRARR